MLKAEGNGKRNSPNLARYNLSGLPSIGFPLLSFPLYVIVPCSLVTIPLSPVSEIIGEIFGDLNTG